MRAQLPAAARAPGPGARREELPNPSRRAPRGSHAVPERLKHIFIIRAPWIFATLYAMVRPMLNKGTADKVVILTDDYLPTLLEHIPAETIPASLGGAAPEPDISEGGMVPVGALAAEAA